MKQIEAGSYYSYLTEGCRLCGKGAKLVLFITGICPNTCFYCPISEERIGKDVIFANEREVKNFRDFEEELNLMDAEGIAVTGGEPLLKLDRVLDYLKSSHKLGLHSHLYTSLPAKENVIEKLSKYLDEIRFHPPELNNVKSYEEALKTSKKLGIESGFEIPAIKYVEDIVEVLNRNDAFLNLNQLECSPTNYDALIVRNFEVKDYYVDCENVVRKYEGVKKFHYCSAKFKDSVQFRRRLIRMAKKLAKSVGIHEVTDDGTVVCGFIESSKEKMDCVKKLLMKMGIKFLEVEDGIEISLSAIERLGEYLKAEGLSVSVIERYPTSNRIVIEVHPL